MTPHFDAATLIMGILLVGSALALNSAYQSWREIRRKPIEDKKVEFPIEYPMEPMFDNFCSIMEDINSAKTDKEFTSVYLRLIIFEGCYDDSETFKSDLRARYNLMENQIRSQSH